MTSRRHFLATTLAASLTGTLAGSLGAQTKRPPRILLRSSWQVVNIGDIAHTPGVLALIEKHLPDAEVRLWASGDLSEEVAAMEHHRFPKLQIVKGKIEADGKANNAALADAVAWADFLLHGSGPGFVAAADVEAWRKTTGKPFGIFGITIGAVGTEGLVTYNAAKFVYTRDSVSLEVAKKAGVTAPILEVGQDGAFACDLRNDAAADTFLKANGLEEGKFLCCIPRFRNTPYWTIPGKKRPFDAKKDERNQAMKEHDAAPLRAAIEAVVKETPLKVLVCPEDMTQMAIGKEMLIDKLSPEAKAKVVWRENFWLTDEALSTYVRSAGLFGHEMHSPIMCIGNGIPAIVCRWAEQTSKGIMWRDIGLADWLFDFDKEDEIPKLVPAVLALAKDPAGAKAKAEKARAYVAQRQAEMTAVLGRSIPAA